MDRAAPADTAYAEYRDLAALDHRDDDVLAAGFATVFVVRHLLVS
jgi:hypothetical protein